MIVSIRSPHGGASPQIRHTTPRRRRWLVNHVRTMSRKCSPADNAPAQNLFSLRAANVFAEVRRMRPRAGSINCRFELACLGSSRSVIWFLLFLRRARFEVRISRSTIVVSVDGRFNLCINIWQSGMCQHGEQINTETREHNTAEDHTVFAGFVFCGTCDKKTHKREAHNTHKAHTTTCPHC